jgi:hypothetical protein
MCRIIAESACIGEKVSSKANCALGSNKHGTQRSRDGAASFLKGLASAPSHAFHDQTASSAVHEPLRLILGSQVENKQPIGAITLGMANGPTYLWITEKE